MKEPGGLYTVCFEHDRKGSTAKWVQETGLKGRAVHRWGKEFEPMWAMTNPPGHGLQSKTPHLNAITGDYDLFAVWPYAEHYNAGVGGDDERPLSPSAAWM